MLLKMTHFCDEGKRTLHIASLSPEPMVGPAWRQSVQKNLEYYTFEQYTHPPCNLEGAQTVS